jgi:hypothetical protein
MLLRLQALVIVLYLSDITRIWGRSGHHNKLAKLEHLIIFYALDLAPFIFALFCLKENFKVLKQICCFKI